MHSKPRSYTKWVLVVTFCLAPLLGLGGGRQAAALDAPARRQAQDPDQVDVSVAIYLLPKRPDAPGLFEFFNTAEVVQPSMSADDFVSIVQGRWAEAAEATGRPEACRIKTLTVQGHVDFEMGGDELLSAEQLESLQELMAEDATVVYLG
jgi:hypothetical protein